MRVTGLILGLIGSVWGMFVPVEELRWLVVILSIAGLIAACCAMAYPKNAGIIMIIAAILGWIFGKGPFGWPGAVLLIGGIFALSGQGELKS